MTPAARLQAAIELLDAIIASARDGGPAADTLIARYFKERRYAGSRDRRAVRDHVYDAIRRAGERPDTGREAMIGLAMERPDLATLFDGSTHAPMPIEPGEVGSSAGAVPISAATGVSSTVTPRAVRLCRCSPVSASVPWVKSVVGPQSGSSIA